MGISRLPHGGLDPTGVFPSPGQSGCENTTAGQALVNWFPLRTGLVKKDSLLWVFQNDSSSPLLAERIRGFFSGVYCGNMVRLTNQEFLMLRVVHTELTLSFRQCVD